VLLALQSWKVAGTSSSPLIDAMNGIHQGFIAKVLTLGLVLASISAIDAAIYVSSRLLFSLSRDGYFPKVFARLHPTRKVPILATIVCVSAMYLCVLLDVVSPTNAFVLLGSVTTLGFLWAWFIIPLMQIMWRRRLGKERVRRLKWKVPLYPITPIFLHGVRLARDNRAPLSEHTRASRVERRRTSGRRRHTLAHYLDCVLQDNRTTPPHATPGGESRSR